ncbi:MAG: FAD-dependent oxidoreductase [Chloroflexota bacterium]
MMQFENLFTPGKIGKLELRNRIIMSPVNSRTATKDGLITQRQVDFYAARARGGCGMVTVESTIPRPGLFSGRPSIASDEAIPGFSRLVNAIHEGGARAAIEINLHRGKGDEMAPATPAAFIAPGTGEHVRDLSVDDLKKMEGYFRQGVARAIEAGFDSIMIHGASGNLVAEFLSPRDNTRSDKYGGSLSNRARFALDLVRAAREAAGADYPLIFRLCADERVEGGFGLEDAVAAARLLAEAGIDGIDGIDIVSGNAETFGWVVPYMYMPRGCNVHLAQEVKRHVSVPVSVAGRINEPGLAEDILSQGKADFVDLGRALIADPEFPSKAMQGRAPDICQCIACGRCSEPSPAGQPSIVCSVNPFVGKENSPEMYPKPAMKKKLVLVIGGGPGGMQAAVMAAGKGHQVVLWEKGDRLGGMLNLAAVPPGKGEINNLSEYLAHRIQQLQVSVVLGKEATPETVLELSPDAVVVACGSKPLIPRIKGMDKKRPVPYTEILSGRAKAGRRVIVIGGGVTGCETAEFLAQDGHSVTVVEVMPVLASEILPAYARLLLQQLEEKGVQTFTAVQDEAITEKGMDIVDRHGQHVSLAAEDIVVACGMAAERSLFRSLEGRVPELYEVGDCVRPRRIYEATSEGASAGLNI